MGDTIVGQYGMMPTTEYLKKIERTCVYEDPALLDNYMRQELKDMRPDAPVLTSDQIRGGIDEDGARKRGYQGYSPLTLRHTGRRSEAEPYLPDGTFLDHQFIGPGHEVEPRSMMGIPDMKKHADQQRARAKFIKKWPDAEPTVPEHGWHPYKIVKQMAESRDRIKEQLQIFATSMVGWHAGSKLKVDLIKKSNAEKTVYDAEFPSNEGMTLRTRVGHIEAANSIPMGWRSSVDHRFQIAKYGPVRSGVTIADSDWHKNRTQSSTAHEIMHSWETQSIPHSLAIAIADLTEKRRQELSREMDTIAFAKSMEQMNKQQNLIAQDMINTKWNADSTQAPAPHVSLDMLANNNQVKQPEVRQMYGKTVINPHIFEIITNKNRSRQMTSEDIRSAVEQSAEKFELFIQQNNRTTGNQPNVLEAMYESEMTHETKDEKNVFQYSGTVFENASKLPSINYEDYKDESTTRHQRGGKYTYDPTLNKNIVPDGDFAREPVSERHGGTLGGKYTRREIVQDEYDHGANDM